MKNPMKLSLLILSMLIVSIPFSLSAQDTKKEKKIRVKTVKVIDGKEVVKDTTFVLGDDDVLEEVMADLEVEPDDSTEQVAIDVRVETDGEEESVKKVIIVNTDDKNVKRVKGQGNSYFYSIGTDIDVDEDISGGKKVIVLKTDDVADSDGEQKVVVISGEPGNGRVMKWKSGDGEEYVFKLDEDFEKMIEAEIELDELKEMDSMAFFEDMEGLEDMDVHFLHAPQQSPALFFEMEDDNRITDQELRDAGIKNKPDRLDIENIKLNIDNGVVDLSFSLAGDGIPKVVVYNFFGDKVFSGKPELMNGNYELKMDLSTKQHGVYYLQIIQKNSSFTEKLKL